MQPSWEPGWEPARRMLVRMEGGSGPRLGFRSFARRRSPSPFRSTRRPCVWLVGVGRRAEARGDVAMTYRLFDGAYGYAAVVAERRRPGPVRAYIDELLPDILDGTIEPGKVFDRTVGLDGVPDGYRAMNGRESIKVMVTP